MSDRKTSVKRHPGSSFLAQGVVELIVEENCKTVVKFGSVRSTLPQIVHNTNSLVKVTSKANGNFYAMSDNVLNRLIADAITRTSPSYSFFDDIETFVPGDPIGLSAFNTTDILASEYSENDIKTLSEIAYNPIQEK